MSLNLTELARLSDQSREADVRRAVEDGTLKLRERKNKEACPNCEGKYNEVYRYIERHGGKRAHKESDKRWFCLCGWAEVRSKGTTTKEWRTACL